MRRSYLTRTILRAASPRPRTRLQLNPLELRATPASVAGQAFYDSNGNGTIEVGESGVAGVTVFLDTNNNGVVDNGPTKTFNSTNVPIAISATGTPTITSTLTIADVSKIADINVKLSITHTYDSDLTVSLTGPTGAKITLFDGVGGNSANFTNTVLDDQAGISINSGVAPFTGSFMPAQALSAYNNLATNGTWTLTVADTANLDGGSLTAWSLTIVTAGETLTTTNSAGNYSFTGLAAGSYNIAHLVPSGQTQTAPGGDGRYHVTLAAADSLTGQNFGDRLPPATISGLAFNDANANGKQDGGEPAYPNVTVYIDSNNNAKLDVGEPQQITDPTGKYSFTSVVPGDTIVAVVVPGGATQTAPFRSGLQKSAPINVTKRSTDQSEPGIAINPNNVNQVFQASNHLGGTGMSGSVSKDGGSTWTNRIFATGSDGMSASGGDPTMAWDNFGRLFVAHLTNAGPVGVGVSLDGGATFANVINFTGSSDQPTITSGPSSTAGRSLIAVCWNNGGQNVSYIETNAGGIIGAFTAPVAVTNSTGGNFGDIEIGLNGKTAITYQMGGSGSGPDSIFLNVDPDGIGPLPFGARTTITSTNVGGFDFLPAQPDRSVDAEADLEYDTSAAHPGRLYLVYTEEKVNEGHDFETLCRFSDNDGGSWTAAVRVNDDATTNSQVLPRAAIDPSNGDLAISWVDARNDPANTKVEHYAAVSFNGGLSFGTNIKLATGQSTAVGNNGNDYGDYSGLSFVNGRFIAAWADDSNSTGDNPDGTSGMETYIAKVIVANNVPNFFITAVAGQTYANNDFGLKGPANPAVTIGASGVVLNGGAIQRSRVTTIDVTFSTPPTIVPTDPGNAFTLTRNSDLAPVTLTGTLSGSTVTLTFVGGAIESGSLADGKYTLTALAAQFGGGGLDGDANGTPGDNFVLVGTTTSAPKLFRLFGDADGDNDVDNSDFTAFRTAFGGGASVFDSDGDGDTDNADFGAFRTRFGTMLP